MKYAIINTQNEVLEFPRSLEQLLEANILASKEYTLADLASAGVVEVLDVNAPAPDDEYLKDIKPVLQSDGTWKETWVRLDTSDEYKAVATAKKVNNVLEARKYLLSITDWTQMPDVVLPNKTQWATYRQALRDIPTQTGYPWTITWPVKPE